MPSLKEAFERKSNNFNYIRLLAAIAVIIGHAPVIVGADHFDFFTQHLGVFIGGLAVDIFFILSGFLVTASISERGVLFYTGSRILRIFPALILCMALSAFLIGPMLTTSKSYWPDALAYFFGNATLTSIHYSLPGVFSDTPGKVVNGSIWSVFDEVRLYGYLMIVYILGLVRNRSVFNLFFSALVTYAYFSHDTSVLPLSGETDRHVAFLFCIGAFYWTNREQIAMSPLLVFIAAIALAAARGTDKWLPVYYMALPYLVFGVGFARFAPWPSWLGDYSYGIYLYGWPSQQLVFHWKPSMTLLENQIYGCTLATALAVLSWHFVEKPSLGLKGRLIAWINQLPSRFRESRRGPADFVGAPSSPQFAGSAQWTEPAAKDSASA